MFIYHNHDFLLLNYDSLLSNYDSLLLNYDSLLLVLCIMYVLGMIWCFFLFIDASVSSQFAHNMYFAHGAHLAQFH